jgi:succinylglutamate desuccinylase
MTKTLFIGCQTHGDEQVGKFIWNNYPQGKTEFWDYKAILCNPHASFLNKRYFQQDLNRSFPGRIDGNYEQKRALEITNEMQNYDFILDIHQTTAKNCTCIMLTRVSEENLSYCKYFNIENVVIEKYEGSGLEFASVGETVDGLCLDAVFPEKSICLEYSKLENYKAETEQLEADFLNFITRKVDYLNKKYFLMFAKIAKNGALNTENFTNFVSLTLEQKRELNLDKSLDSEEIVPFFIGEKAYPETFCCLAKRIYID